jgi:hypothetical protein
LKPLRAALRLAKALAVPLKAAKRLAKALAVPPLAKALAVPQLAAPLPSNRISRIAFRSEQEKGPVATYVAAGLFRWAAGL